MSSRPKATIASSLASDLEAALVHEVLLSVAYLKGAELEGRERWEGVILNVAEAWDAIDAVSDGCDDAASRVAGRILWHGKKKGEPNGSDGDDQE